MLYKVNITINIYVKTLFNVFSCIFSFFKIFFFFVLADFSGYRFIDFLLIPTLRTNITFPIQGCQTTKYFNYFCRQHRRDIFDTKDLLIKTIYHLRENNNNSIFLFIISFVIISVW